MKLVGSKIVTTLGLALLVLGAAGLGILRGEHTVHADTNQAYTVDANTAAGGVYARYGPHTNDTNRVNGYGVYPSETVMLLCGVTDGDPVGDFNNTTWHFITDESNPGEGDFWVNDHYLDTPYSPGQLAPGEAQCPNESSDPTTSTSNELQPAESIPTFISYDRDAAKAFALAHAEDKPPDAGSCMWFVSQALAAGNFPQTSTWNLGFIGIKKDLTARYGTDAARIVPDFMQYALTLPYVQVEYLGHMSSGNNNVPDAKPGDIIIYDWEGDGIPDHADVVVDHAKHNPQYPLVSGWSENGSEAVNYPYRGWTWSEEHQTWLQAEPGNQNMQAWLIHVRGEDDLHIGS
jgi:hypothetical protein